jgi:hypothetical protein
MRHPANTTHNRTVMPPADENTSADQDREITLGGPAGSTVMLPRTSTGSCRLAVRRSPLADVNAVYVTATNPA